MIIGWTAPTHGSNLRCCCSTNIAKSCFCFALSAFAVRASALYGQAPEGMLLDSEAVTLVMRRSWCAGRLICWNGEEKKHSPWSVGRMLRKDSKGAMLLSSSAMKVNQTMLDQSSLAERT